MVNRPVSGTYSSLCVLSAVLAGFSVAAAADSTTDTTPVDNPRWYQPTAYVGAQLGDNRTIGELGLLIPFAQSQRSLLFADIRGRLDEHSHEYNAGIGYRQVLGKDSVIVGGYAYYDRLESEFDNRFTQYTLGAEIQTRNWRLRLNHYDPKDSGGQGIAPEVTTTSGSPNQLYLLHLLDELRMAILIGVFLIAHHKLIC